MHGDVKAVRIQNYQATVSLYLSEASSHCDGRKFIGTFFFFFSECPNSDQSSDNEG